MPKGTIAKGRAATTPLRLHHHAIPEAPCLQGIATEQCLHLHDIARTARVTILLYSTAAALELLIVDMLCATLLDIDLVHTAIPEHSIIGGGYNCTREITTVMTMTTVVVAMA
jgi:hypothetical protein